MDRLRQLLKENNLSGTRKKIIHRAIKMVNSGKHPIDVYEQLVEEYK